MWFACQPHCTTWEACPGSSQSFCRGYHHSSVGAVQHLTEGSYKQPLPAWFRSTTHETAVNLFSQSTLWTYVCNRNLGTPQVDVWAAGVCLYVWLWGKLPFQGDSIPDMFTAIRKQPLTFPDTPAYGPECKHLITQVMSMNQTCSKLLSMHRDHVHSDH